MIMESAKIDITKIEYNKGQIDGIPANPRKISKADLELIDANKKNIKKIEPTGATNERRQCK